MNKHKPRYLVGAAQASLTAKIGHPPEYAASQDWDLVVSDPKRITEFLSKYETLDLNDDERFALMALIVASFDQLPPAGAETGHVWTDISRLLRSDRALHESTIRRWALLDDPDVEDGFPVTGRMRTLALELKLQS